MAAFGVTHVVLFGSMLDESVPGVSDVDVAIGLVQVRDLGTDHAFTSYQRHLQGRRPKLGEPLYREDVLAYLKGGKPVLSPVDWEQHRGLLATLPNRIIWVSPAVGTAMWDAMPPEERQQVLDLMSPKQREQALNHFSDRR